jgi:hypothetical protein
MVPRPGREIRNLKHSATSRGKTTDGGLRPCSDNLFGHVCHHRQTGLGRKRGSIMTCCMFSVISLLYVVAGFLSN